jgi:hypothetical protein
MNEKIARKIANRATNKIFLVVMQLPKAHKAAVKKIVFDALVEMVMPYHQFISSPTP